MTRKKPGEEEEYMNPISRFEKISSSETASPPWSSKAMRDSVEEVCRDIAWGKRREIGRIGLSLQDHICRDLIHEFVSELVTTSTTYHAMPPPHHHHHPQYHSLPFEACKRRLCFQGFFFFLVLILCLLIRLSFFERYVSCILKTG